MTTSECLHAIETERDEALSRATAAIVAMTTAQAERDALSEKLAAAEQERDERKPWYELHNTIESQRRQLSDSVPQELHDKTVDEHLDRERAIAGRLAAERDEARAKLEVLHQNCELTEQRLDDARRQLATLTAQRDQAVGDLAAERDAAASFVEDRLNWDRSNDQALYQIAEDIRQGAHRKGLK